MKALEVLTVREKYFMEDVRDTMTVGELTQFLSDYDDDTPIYLSFDGGYTYGGISEDQMIEHYE